MKENISSLEETTRDLKSRIKSFEETIEDRKSENNQFELKIADVNNKMTQMENNMNNSILSLNKQILDLKDKIEEQKSLPINSPPEPAKIVQQTNTKLQIRIMGVKEAPSDMNHIDRHAYELNCIQNILAHINETNIHITDCFRMGKFKADSQRPRTLLVTLSSVWDKRKILSKTTLLSNFGPKIFISPALSPSEINIEKRILKKRWELISKGVERKNIKIRSLKLFVNDEEIDFESE